MWPLHSMRLASHHVITVVHALQAAGKGPHAAATAEALQAAARKPPARVLFKPAAKIAAPERPGAALAQQQEAALANRQPANQQQPTADELSIEVNALYSTCGHSALSDRRGKLRMHAACSDS